MWRKTRTTSVQATAGFSLASSGLPLGGDNGDEIKPRDPLRIGNVHARSKHGAVTASLLR